MRNAYKSMVGKPERDHSEGIGIDGTIILKCILGKQGGTMWIGYIWLRIRTNGRLL
jgi:hypothetical protein